jgi:hypothetical protein
MKIGKSIIFRAISSIIILLFYSCGSAKVDESDSIIILPNSVSIHQIESALLKNGYTIDKQSSNQISTNWKKTNIELATFRVEIESKSQSWEMKGKIKYEDYRDREMDETVYRVDYANSKSNIFVVKYGWQMLQKVENDIINNNSVIINK